MTTTSGIFPCIVPPSRKSRSVSGTNAKAGGQRPALRSLYRTRHRFLQQRFRSAPALAGRFGVQLPGPRVLTDMEPQIGAIQIPFRMSAARTVVPALRQRLFHHLSTLTALREPGGPGREPDHPATGACSLAAKVIQKHSRSPVADAPAEHPLKGFVRQFLRHHRVAGGDDAIGKPTVAASR